MICTQAEKDLLLKYIQQWKELSDLKKKVATLQEEFALTRERVQDCEFDGDDLPNNFVVSHEGQCYLLTFVFTGEGEDEYKYFDILVSEVDVVCLDTSLK